MAIINVDDAYTLNETGAQVDKVTGLFTKNENATTDEKQMARLNIAAGGSNINLLDNAYFVGGGSQLGDGVFPINQRGLTSYAGGGTTFDRWRLSSGGSMTLAPEGVSVNGLMYQKKRLDLTVGDTYTLSRKTTDGNIVSVTGIVSSAEGWAVGNQSFGVYFRPSTKVCDIQIWGEYFLQAIKLEKGTYSTLANNVLHDFGEELRKCQRDFVRFSPKINSRAYIGTGSANNSNNMLIFVPTPVTLRTTPTISYSMCNCYNWVVGGTIGLNAINLDSWSDNGVFVSCVPSDASQAPQGQPYALRVASGGFFDLSCEL